jgi:hypothetical protein
MIINILLHFMYETLYNICLVLININNNNNNKLYFKRVTQLVFTNLTWGPPKNMIDFAYNINMTHSMHNITN